MALASLENESKLKSVNDYLRLLALVQKWESDNKKLYLAEYTSAHLINQKYSFQAKKFFRQGTILSTKTGQSNIQNQNLQVPNSHLRKLSSGRIDNEAFSISKFFDTSTEETGTSVLQTKDIVEETGPTSENLSGSYSYDIQYEGREVENTSMEHNIEIDQIYGGENLPY